MKRFQDPISQAMCKAGAMKGKELSDMTVRQLDGTGLSPIGLVSLHSWKTKKKNKELLSKFLSLSVPSEICWNSKTFGAGFKNTGSSGWNSIA